MGSWNTLRTRSSSRLISCSEGGREGGREGEGRKGEGGREGGREGGGREGGGREAGRGEREGGGVSKKTWIQSLQQVCVIMLSKFWFCT